MFRNAQNIDVGVMTDENVVSCIINMAEVRLQKAESHFPQQEGWLKGLDANPEQFVINNDMQKRKPTLRSKVERSDQTPCITISEVCIKICIAGKADRGQVLSFWQSAIMHDRAAGPDLMCGFVFAVAVWPSMISRDVSFVR